MWCTVSSQCKHRGEFASPKYHHGQARGLSQYIPGNIEARFASDIETQIEFQLTKFSIVKLKSKRSSIKITSYFNQGIRDY
jgi:hypothetical protein